MSEQELDMYNINKNITEIIANLTKARKALNKKDYREASKLFSVVAYHADHNDALMEGVWQS